jgi:hypothetical protein
MERLSINSKRYRFFRPGRRYLPVTFIADIPDNSVLNRCNFVIFKDIIEKDDKNGRYSIKNVTDR